MTKGFSHDRFFFFPLLPTACSRLKETFLLLNLAAVETSCCHGFETSFWFR